MLLTEHRDSLVLSRTSPYADPLLVDDLPIYAQILQAVSSLAI
jgi:hypothetical protein